MNTGYRPKVDVPQLPNNIVQMESEGFQPPFYFGGSDMNAYKEKQGSGLKQDIKEIFGKVKIFKPHNVRKK